MRTVRSTVVELEVNGEPQELLAKPGTTLLTTLRETLGLMSPKRGCEVGSCGSCTVLVDDTPVMSCLVPVETIDGSSVQTLEGAGVPDGALDALQSAFLENFATQCGFCTPGMIMAGRALLDANPTPTRDEVITAISGNVCRCTGYEAILTAILDAAEREAAPAQDPSAPGSSQAPSARSATAPAQETV